jgi:hypothetical protein
MPSHDALYVSTKPGIYSRRYSYISISMLKMNLGFSIIRQESANTHDIILLIIV